MQAEKGLSADSIKCLCKEHFGKQAFSSKTIYKWISMYKLGVPLNEERGKPGPKPDEQLLTRIQELLEEEPFISVRQIAQQLNEAPTTIHRYLTVFLGRQYKVTKWIPHLLTSAQKEERVRLSNSLHTILQRSQRKGWYNIITGDESLFHFSYGQKGAWLLQDDKSPEMDGSKISEICRQICSTGTFSDTKIFSRFIIRSAVAGPNSRMKNSLANRTSALETTPSILMTSAAKPESARKNASWVDCSACRRISICDFSIKTPRK